MSDSSSREKVLISLIDNVVLDYLHNDPQLSLPIEILKIILQYSIRHCDIGLVYENKRNWTLAIKEYILAVEYDREYVNDEEYASCLYKSAHGYRRGQGAVTISRRKALDCHGRNGILWCYKLYASTRW